MEGVNLENYKNALRVLDEAMLKPPANPLERDGLIKRFDYCFEISWKSADKVLQFHGLKADTPRNIFRELARIGWINNPEQWIEFLEARNKTSHLYHEKLAEELFQIIPIFLEATHKLLVGLEEKLK